jgi:CBS-domain-containing membrane protein
MNPSVVKVSPGTDQEECARILQRYDLQQLPVVDGQGQVLGVILAEDIIDVMEQEATEDMLRARLRPEDGAGPRSSFEGVSQPGPVAASQPGYGAAGGYQHQRV